MQEPTAGATSYVHWRLMDEIRRQGIKVVINGQGADEALAGYGHYIKGYRLLDVLQTQPLAAWGEARAIVANMPGGGAGLLAQTAKAVLGRRLASRIRASWVEGSAGVLDAAFRAAHADYLPDLPMAWGGRNLESHLRGQLHDYGFNQILHYEDQSSMSQGIEIRSPFVDYRVMEFAFALPSEEKFSGGVTKRILRDAFRHRVPDCIIRNENKIGFGVPFSDWLADQSLLDMVRDLVSSSGFRGRTVWRADRLGKLLLDPQATRRGFPAWRFLVAALWMEEFGIMNA
jgi:asparagine synthase (glutamine-hydrolysing)